MKSGIRHGSPIRYRSGLKMFKSRPKLQFVGGLIIGILMSLLTRKITREMLYIIRTSTEYTYVNIENFKSYNTASFEDSGLLLVGVQTADKYLDTRMKGAYETWAQSMTGDVIFFTGEESASFADKSDIPLVALPGVHDYTYPPQKKSFLMLKFMHDLFLDKYEWFLRADDDAYFIGPKLEKFLSSLNSSKPYYIGQGGDGREDERGKLGLSDNMAYCMGGPGVIISRAALAMFAPHIGDCLQKIVSTHEDTELGRCIYKYAGVSCTRAAEMRHLFYQNYKQLSGSIDPAESKIDISEALTLHPFKNHSYLYEMRSYLNSQKLKDLKKKSYKIMEEIKQIEAIFTQKESDIQTKNNEKRFILNHSDTKERLRNDIPIWTGYKGKIIYSHKEMNPRHMIEEAEMSTMVDSIFQLEKDMAKNSKLDGRPFFVKHFEYGYNKITPATGIEYIFDLKVCCKKARSGKGIVNYTQSFKLSRNFATLETEEQPIHKHSTMKSNSWTGILSRNTYAQPKEPTVHFVIPLFGKLSSFKVFIENFENAFLRDGLDVSLLVVLYWKDSNRAETLQLVSMITSLQTRFPQHRIQLLKEQGDFNRGIALNKGASMFTSDDLLFFVDIDCYVDPTILLRIKSNTRQGNQVYFPVMFSLYDPKFVWGRRFDKTNFAYSEESGYWRFHSYGQVSIYKSDFDRIKGYDTTIRGWGKEDIDFFQRVIDKKITAFRSPDLGLIHIYHPIHCSLELPHEQYRMCMGTKWSTVGSESRLAKIVYSTVEIMDRNNE